MLVVLTGTRLQSFWSSVTLEPKTAPSPPPEATLVQAPDAPDFVYRRFVHRGCAAPPSVYTASITSDARGAKAPCLASCTIVLSMVAIALNPEVHDVPVSAFVDLRTLLSTS